MWEAIGPVAGMLGILSMLFFAAVLGWLSAVQDHSDNEWLRPPPPPWDEDFI